MTSLRKKVTSYFRQLSFHNEPRERKTNVNENSFVTKYLTGQIKLKDGPPVLYGKSPNDLPNFELGNYLTGTDSIVGCSTGPNGGLTTVKRTEKHLSVTDPDIDFIDTQEEIGSHDGTQTSASNLGDDDSSLPLQWNRKSNFVYGLSDSLYDVNQVTKCKNGNPIADCFGIIARSDSAVLALADGVNWGEKACIAAKSAIHGCLHYLNKTIFDDTSLFDFSYPSCTSPTENSPINTSFTPPPDFSANKIKTGATTSDSLSSNENRISNTSEVFVSILRAFNCAHNLILENEGMLTTLTVAVVLPLKSTNYKKPLKQEDSTESVSSNKESANISGVPNIVGDIESKKPVIRPVRSVDSSRSNPEVSSRSSVSFDGKQSEKYICCVCNVGDTLAYVYSPKYGVRELTKGSHDVHSNRDMRDALGALGPVDGINPELNNLTLSVTTIDPGDIVMIASDGLTDNYDPTVCKYTVNSVLNETSKQTRQQPPQTSKDDKSSASKVSTPYDSRSHRDRKPSLSLRKDQTPPKPAAPSNVVRLAQQPSTSDTNKGKTQSITSVSDVAISKNKENNLKSKRSSGSHNTVDSNPLIAQFMADNGFENKKGSFELKVSNKSSQSINKRTSSKSKRANVGNVLSENKINPLSKSSSTSGVFKIKNTSNESTSKYNFLRSKTSIDLQPPRHVIQRNEDGLPYVTPIQKYELTLLLIEDILKRGISGKEKQCTTAKSLCENLLRYTISITAAKRHTLEDVDLYFDNKNDILVEVSQREKKIRRKRCLEKVQSLPGKLDHVSIVAYNVGNRTVDLFD